MDTQEDSTNWRYIAYLWKARHECEKERNKRRLLEYGQRIREARVKIKMRIAAHYFKCMTGQQKASPPQHLLDINGDLVERAVSFGAWMNSRTN